MKEHHITVLLYHQVGNFPNRNTNLDCYCRISNFQAQMQYLHDHDIKVVSLKQATHLISENRKLTSSFAVLSFDDGCESFYTKVHPILREFGYPAILYPVVGYIGKRASWNGLRNTQIKLVTQKQLVEIRNYGYEIGSHSLDHPKLDQLEKEEVFHQIWSSKSHLESILEQNVESFAFPHGKYNQETVKALIECGYRNAVTCQSDFAEVTSSLFEIPRKYITYFETTQSFASKFN
jgi:peptidoglycan/xylan/chitin deacetylase (PgdA/CDA1 family)